MGTVRLWIEALLRQARPSSLRSLAYAWARFPWAYDAERTIANTTTLTLADLERFGGGPVTSTEIPPLLGPLVRMEYNARVDEQLALGLTLRAWQPHRLFELGTFDGNMTGYFARLAGSESHVWTLDLPDAAVNAMGLDWFRGADVGRKFHSTPEEARITQLRGDASSFDFSPYFGSMDFVFVDTVHDYISAQRDSRIAFSLVRHGGLIAWHDYSPQYPGVVRAVREATSTRAGSGGHLTHLERTNVALWISQDAQHAGAGIASADGDVQAGVRGSRRSS